MRRINYYYINQCLYASVKDNKVMQYVFCVKFKICKYVPSVVTRKGHTINKWTFVHRTPEMMLMP